MPPDEICNPYVCSKIFNFCIITNKDKVWVKAELTKRKYLSNRPLSTSLYKAQNKQIKPYGTIIQKS